MSIDIRQSQQFARFMEYLGWKTESVGKNKIYLRKFPLFGYFAKIPRPTLPLDWNAIDSLKSANRLFKLKIAPNVLVDDKKYLPYKREFQKNGLTPEQTPFNPVTTIYIDLQRPENEIFNSFTSAKRRAVRRALRNHLEVKVSNDFESFIEIRKRQYFPMGFLMVKEMQSLWKNFYPHNASLLLAYQTSFQPNPNSPPTFIHTTVYKNVNRPLAGILLLYYKKTAYYWLASSLMEGKKLFAPTLLVWEALKLAKKKGCIVFDFEGIYDERFPKASESWKGFTKFKEGFGGEKVVFMENFTS